MTKSDCDRPGIGFLCGLWLALGLVLMIGFGVFYSRAPSAIAAHPMAIFWIGIVQLLLSLVFVAYLAVRQRFTKGPLSATDERYRLLAEHSPDILVLTDLSGRRQYVSPAVTNLLGWLPDELTGEHASMDIVHPEDSGRKAGALSALDATHLHRAFSYRLRDRAGHYRWMEANVAAYEDAKSHRDIGYIHVIRDVSERKSSEEDLKIAYQALEQLATADPLTGVANRRRFDEILHREWRRAIRAESPVSLLMLDVDLFKPYNDSYGHLRGDSCLRQIAEAALDVVRRPSDLVARYGGEEFAIILAGTDSSGAQQVGEQVRELVQCRGLTHQSSPVGVVTISVGCATLVPVRGSNPTQLIEIADQALYLAKANGRNRVETACCDGSALPEEWLSARHSAMRLVNH